MRVTMGSKDCYLWQAGSVYYHWEGLPFVGVWYCWLGSIDMINSVGGGRTMTSQHIGSWLACNTEFSLNLKLKLQSHKYLLSLNRYTRIVELIEGFPLAPPCWVVQITEVVPKNITRNANFWDEKSDSADSFLALLHSQYMPNIARTTQPWSELHEQNVLMRLLQFGQLQVNCW